MRRYLELTRTVEKPPYLLGVRTIAERFSDSRDFPFSLQVVKDLDVAFDRPVTIFVGENGGGKSTVLEAIVVLCGLPVSGGAKADLASQHGPETDSTLSKAMRPSFRKRPRDGYFLRAEFHAHFALPDHERNSSKSSCLLEASERKWTCLTQFVRLTMRRCLDGRCANLSRSAGKFKR